MVSCGIWALRNGCPKSHCDFPSSLTNELSTMGLLSPTLCMQRTPQTAERATRIPQPTTRVLSLINPKSKIPNPQSKDPHPATRNS